MSDDDPDIEEFQSNMTDMIESMFGPGPFGTGVDEEMPEGVRLAVLCTKSAHAIEQLNEYLEENDVELEDPHTINEMDVEGQAVVMGLSVLSGPIERLTEIVGDDDDGDNPFKVSDGDDPVY